MSSVIVPISEAAQKARDGVKRLPVSTLGDLFTLDPAEIEEGYHAAFFDRITTCGDNASRAYWHGWRNGMMDRGEIQRDWASASLAREIVKFGGSFERLIAYHKKQFEFWREMGMA